MIKQLTAYAVIACILSVAGYVTLVLVDWRIAVATFFIQWGNNIQASLEKKISRVRTNSREELKEEFAKALFGEVSNNHNPND